MDKSELRVWLLDKIASCYRIRYESTNNRNLLYYWIYNDSIVRRKKLLNISGISDSTYSISSTMIYSDISKGNVLFEYDNSNSYFWCNEDLIWAILEENFPGYDLDYSLVDIKKFITDVLLDVKDFKFENIVYTGWFSSGRQEKLLHRDFIID